MSSSSLSTWQKPLLATAVGLSAFTSASIASMSLITMPSLLSNTTNPSILLTSWHASMAQGFRIMPKLAMFSSAAHLINFFLFYRRQFSSTSSLSASVASGPTHPKYFALLAAVMTSSIIPFTIVVLQSTNVELFKREKAARETATIGMTGSKVVLGVEAGTVDLLKKWARLNLIRSVLPAVGAFLGVLAL